MNYQTLTQNLEAKLSIADLPKKTKDEILLKLGQAILERTNLTIIESLSEEEAKNVTLLLEDGKLEEVMNFLSEKHPELDEKIVAISNDVVREFLEG